MKGKCEIHHNQTYSVFYGKDLVEWYFKYHSET